MPKFLLDENVRYELLVFLKNKGFDVKFSPKGATDSVVAHISKNEGRILVTNDVDFEFASKSEVFSVILLKIHQADKEGLLKSFERLLINTSGLQGMLVLLNAESNQISKLE